MAELTGAFALSLIASLVATPFAIRLATRTGFFDTPGGTYKAHGNATPYLGGVAVVGAFLLGATAFGWGFDGLAPIAGGALVLWFVGTMDDRYNISPNARMAVEAALAGLLWLTGNGWDVFGADALNLALTVFWILGIVNAFNLMDNMDGAASTVASISSAGAGALALIDNEPALAALCFALSGACAGFLPYNLRSPSRIFLGDGGSMPVGFVVAATVMAVGSGETDLGMRALFASAVLVGLPILDTTLVVISRRRRGISVLTGGRDHLTHRLRTQLPSARAVALALALLQTSLCLLVIGATTLGSPLLLSVAALCFILGATAIGMLERPGWIGEPAMAGAGGMTVSGDGPVAVAITKPAPVDLLLLGLVGLGAGLSAFFSGLYNISAWGPYTLVAAAVLVAIALARPRELPARGALVSAGALTVLWLWSLISSAWGDSADSAWIEAGRWLLYLVVFLGFSTLIRSRRAGEAVIGGFVLGVVIVAGYTTVGLLVGHADKIFLGGRLNGPLGYVNGQASYFLLALWPVIALAERAKRSAVSGAAVSFAALLAGLALMTETRAIMPAVAISVITLVAVFPGRDRRLWVLFAIAIAVAAAGPSLLDVYRATGGASAPPAAVATHAVRNLLITSALAGIAWMLVTGGAQRLATRSQSARRYIPLLSKLAVAGICLALVAGALATVGNPISRARTELHAFTHLAGNGSGSRFLSGGGNRYDYWRVAVDEFNAHPLKGVGAGNYAPGYFAARKTNEDIRQPHSLELQTLAELGLVGGAALALLLTAIFMGLGRRAFRARYEPQTIGLSVAAGGIFITWLIHTSVDWIHLLPGLTTMALAAAAVMVAPTGARVPTLRGRLGVAWPALAIVLALFAVLTVGRLTLADHFTSQAGAQIVSDPAAAIRAADRARSLDSQAVKPLYTRAAAYARLGSYEQSKASLLEAIRLEPENFVSWALLGDLATRRGDRALAHRAYSRAAQLNPRDASLKQAVQTSAARS